MNSDSVKRKFPGTVQIFDEVEENEEIIDLERSDLLKKGPIIRATRESGGGGGGEHGEKEREGGGEVIISSSSSTSSTSSTSTPTNTATLYGGKYLFLQKLPPFPFFLFNFP